MGLAKMLLAGLALAGAYFAFSGAKGSAGRTFAQPAETAIDRLRLKRRDVDGTGMGPLTMFPAGREGEALLIAVKRAGEQARVECRVTVRALCRDTSRAETDCSQPNPDGATMRRLGADALAIAVREHVAATIEDRPYDIDGVADGMLAFVAINSPAIAASLAPKE